MTKAQNDSKTSGFQTGSSFNGEKLRRINVPKNGDKSATERSMQ